MVELGTILSFIQAFGIAVGVAYYIMNIRISQRNQEMATRNQEMMLKAQQQTLETRQAQMFMGIYNQLTNKEFMDAYQKIMNSQWNNYDEYRELFKDPEFQTAAYFMGSFYEGLGVLVKEGFLDIKWIALLICGMTRTYWEKIETTISEIRIEHKQPRMGSETEYLYNELMKYLEKHPELKT